MERRFDPLPLMRMPKSGTHFISQVQNIGCSSVLNAGKIQNDVSTSLSADIWTLAVTKPDSGVMSEPQTDCLGPKQALDHPTFSPDLKALRCFLDKKIEIVVGSIVFSFI